MALTAITIGCVAPGSLLSQPPALAPAASIEAVAPVPTSGGSECAAVSCDRGSSSSPGLPPGLAVTGVLSLAALVVVAALTIRRRRTGRTVLPAGAPRLLLRPPQLSPLNA